jgi:RNA ligase (TIGR02306 family)
MRKLTQIKTIDRIEPIDGADRIVVAVIGGWNTVVKKDEFTVGQKVLYIEVDAFLPAAVDEFAFLSEKGGKTVIGPAGEEVFGHLLKTVRLRGQISQGLVLPLSFGLTEDSIQEDVDAAMDALGVFKWEPPLSQDASIVGPFPWQAQKTDSERVQNLSDGFLSSLDPNEWFATEKIDGTSATFVMTEDGLKVASRNCEVDIEDSIQGKIAKLMKLDQIMPVGSVIQGEIFGEGIQKNPLKIQGNKLMVFSANVGDPTTLDAGTIGRFMEFFTANSVPVLPLVLPGTVKDAIAQVDGMKSTINPKVNAEGVVWWNRLHKRFNETGYRSNFKAINNRFLLKSGN